MIGMAMRKRTGQVRLRVRVRGMCMGRCLCIGIDFSTAVQERIREAVTGWMGLLGGELCV